MAGIGLTPQSSVWFHRVPWDSKYQNVVKFASQDAQIEYFKYAEQHSMSFNCTFQTIEMNMEVRADIPIDDVLELRSNYITFSNYRYEVGTGDPRNKRHYYAFLKGVRYASFNSCFLDIQLDVYQTFMFDITLRQCFVKREHISSDTIGANTVPESLETGKLKMYTATEKSSINNLGILATATTTRYDNAYSGGRYSGLVNGLGYFYFPPTEEASFKSWIEARNDQGTEAGIASIAMVPDEFVGSSTPGSSNTGPEGWFFPWNVNDVCYISQGYNYTNGNTNNHTGRLAIDFARTGSSSSSPVALYSPTWGTIAYVNRNPSASTYGCYVRIHTSKYRIIMAHFDDANFIPPAVGTSVTPSTALGWMGSTGNSTGVHLHFEIQTLSGGVVSPASIPTLFNRRITSFEDSNSSQIWGQAGTQGGSPPTGAGFWTVPQSASAIVTTMGLPKKVSGALDGYTPKNSKLYTYPFNYLLGSNNQGSMKEYRYERMPNGDTFPMKFSADISPNPTLFCYPSTYNGVNNHYDEGMRITGFPQIPIEHGAYANWLAQNSGSAILGAAIGVGAVAAGAVTGYVPAIAGGTSSLVSTIGMFIDQSRQPDTPSGNSSGTGLASQKKMNFTFYNVGLSAEYARRIDEYFERFGYATNRLKVPNVSSRPVWNYVETADCKVQGNMPQDFIDEINNMFNRGVTFWKNPNQVGNYALNNH